MQEISSEQDEVTENGQNDVAAEEDTAQDESEADDLDEDESEEDDLDEVETNDQRRKKHAFACFFLF